MRMIAVSSALLAAMVSLAQKTPKEHIAHVEQAIAYYKAADYANAAAEYEEAFNGYDRPVYFEYRLNAARAHALAGNADDAFRYLNHFCDDPDIRFRDPDQLLGDPGLVPLHADGRWQALLAKARENKYNYEKDLDHKLVAVLDTILEDDQLYRSSLQRMEADLGRDSEEVRKLWDQIQKQDSINLVKVKRILDERGWLGRNILGDDGNQALFLVIQHADLATQQKYLPMMREAVSLGNAQASDLAYLEDRVALDEGRMQIYGTQIGVGSGENEYYVRPLLDPEHVDQRRAMVGLGPLAEYVEWWGIKWSPKAQQAPIDH